MMAKVYLGLISQEGDRLGHLVRGVQMLRSYGDEARVIGYSSVVDWSGQADEPPALCCVLECQSDATEEALNGICRETEWALGDEPDVLQVHVLRHGATESGDAPAPLLAMLAGSDAAGMTMQNDRYEFARLCDWGQQLIGEDADVIGEWPSATGR
jgi:hypothetical protein